MGEVLEKEIDVKHTNRDTAENTAVSRQTASNSTAVSCHTATKGKSRAGDRSIGRLEKSLPEPPLPKDLVEDNEADDLATAFAAEPHDASWHAITTGLKTRPKLENQRASQSLQPQRSAL